MTSWYDTAAMYMISAEGPDRRFLGGSARERNTRVALRAGAALHALGDIADDDTHPAVFVPADTALMLTVFGDAALADAAARSSCTRLESNHGASIVVGPAAAVAAWVRGSAGLPSLPRLRAGDDTILDLATRRSRRRATGVALRATEKATDGFVSRHFNRPISRACSRAALALGLSATGASLATLAFGLLTAFAASFPGYRAFVFTGLGFHLASVLDGVDGEIARSTLTESERGARVDTIVDQATYLACLGGVTIGWVREGSGMAALASALAVIAALVLTLLWAARFVARHADNASFVFIDRSVRRAARETGRLPLRLAAALFTLLRRDLFAVLFLAVSLTGQRALIPVLVLAGVAIANVTFALYGRELADAARAERQGLALATPA